MALLSQGDVTNHLLPPKMEQLVAEKMKAGLTVSIDYAVYEGLRLLSERDRLAEAFEQDLQAGFTRSTSENIAGTGTVA